MAVLVQAPRAAPSSDTAARAAAGLTQGVSLHERESHTRVLDAGIPSVLGGTVKCPQNVHIQYFLNIEPWTRTLSWCFSRYLVLEPRLFTDMIEFPAGRKQITHEGTGGAETWTTYTRKRAGAHGATCLTPLRKRHRRPRLFSLLNFKIEIKHFR